MSLKRFQRGDPIPVSAARRNELIDAVDHILSPGATGESQSGSSGISFFPNAETYLAIYELTEALTYPAAAEKAPWTSGARLVSFIVGEEIYGGTAAAKDEKLYFPLAWRDDDGDYIGKPSMSSGDRVLVWFNPQSRRQEIIVPAAQPLDRCKAILKGAISGSGDKTVDNVVATRGPSPLTDPTDSAEELTVNNDEFEFAGDDNGSCKIEYNHADNAWEFYQVECPA